MLAAEVFYCFPKLQNEMTASDFKKEWESRKRLLEARAQFRRERSERRDGGEVAQTDDEDSVGVNEDNVGESPPAFDPATASATLPDRAEDAAREYEQVFRRCRQSGDFDASPVRHRGLSVVITNYLYPG